MSWSSALWRPAAKPMQAGATPNEITSASESSSRPIGDDLWRHRAMRPSSTSKTKARGTKSAAVYRCARTPVARNVMAQNRAATPQKPFAIVKRSAR